MKKLYYSIGEVARLFDLAPHVLRYWETEFTQLHPRKNASGTRLYRESDIEIIQRIRHLLYENRFTIEGARRELERDRSDEVSVSADPDLQGQAETREIKLPSLSPAELSDSGNPDFQTLPPEMLHEVRTTLREILKILS